MLDTTIYENSMFDTPAARDTLVGDGKLCTELFFINFLGFLGLYALNDSRGYMKTYGSTEKKLKINEIGDDNHDASLVIKLAVDSGVLAEAKTVQVTRLLSLIKQRTVRSKDVDSARIRLLIEHTMMHVKPMGGMVKQHVTAFMDGQIDIKEFSRQIYDVAKNNAWRPYTLELRTLILKGQYTDYFTAMKRGIAVSPPANQTAGAPQTAAAAAAGVAGPGAGAASRVMPGAKATPPTSHPAPAVKPAAPPKTTLADVKKDLSAIVDRHDADAASIIRAFDNYAEVTKRGESDVPRLMSEVIPTLDTGLFASGWKSADVHNAYSNLINLRALEAIAEAKIWHRFTSSAMSLVGPTHATSSDPIVKKAHEIVTNAVLKFGVPTNSNFDDWAVLFRLFKAIKPVLEDRRKLLEPLVKPMDPGNHNIHFLNLYAPPGASNGSAPHMLETASLGSKALAWVRKWGTNILGANGIVLTSNITTAHWKAMSGTDQWLWMAKNFNPVGAKKLTTFRRNERGLPRPASITDSARAEIVEILKGKWNDEALLAAMDSAGNDSTFWKPIAAMVGVTEVLKAKRAIPFPEALRSALGTNHEAYVSNEMKAVRLWMDDLPATTASEVLFFNQVAGMFYDRSMRRVIDPGFLNLQNDAPHSHVKWLPWARPSRQPPDGISDWGERAVIIDGAKVSKSVKEWVVNFGTSSDGAVVRMTEEVFGLDAAAEIVLKGLASNAQKTESFSISDDLLTDLKAFTVEDWFDVAKRVYEKGGVDSLFKAAPYTVEGVVSTRGITIHDYANLMGGVSRFVTNEIPYAEKSSGMGIWTSLEALRAPMTADKMKYASEMTSGRSHARFNPIYVVDLLTTAIDADLWAPAHTSCFNAMLKQSFDYDPAGFGAAVEKMAATGKEEYRIPVITGISIGKLTPASHKAYRWAWKLTAADIESILKEQNEQLAAGAAKRDFNQNYSPLKIRLDTSERLKEIVGADWLNTVSASIAAAYYYITTSLHTSPWLDEVDLSVVKPAPLREGETLASVMATVQNVLTDLDGLTNSFAIVQQLVKPIIDMMSKGNIADIDGFYVDRLVGIAKDNGVDTAEIEKIVDATFKAYSERNMRPVDYAGLAESLKGNSTEYIKPEHMTAIVKQLASSTAKSCQEAISALAYTAKSNGTISKSFIDAVRTAGVERAVLSRLRNTAALGQAASRLNSDPNGSRIDLTPSRISDFLKYNDVDVSIIKVADAKKLEDIGKFSDALNTIIPPLAMTEDLSPTVKKDTARFLHENNRYNHNPALGLEVKRVFKVALPNQRDRFDAWVAANPTTRIMTLFHGTGTWAAQFLLRYGFRIIKPTDGSVTGRMLGDGIYFADNINKSMLYMSNAGYIRQEGQEGYVFKCKVALGRQPKDHREGAAASRRLVSNEWAIFSLDQIIIEEAYLGVSRRKQEIQMLLNEAGDEYVPTVSSFMFMDGMIPITPELLTDFEKMPEFGAHVTIETSAKGPIVNIRHDSTVEPVSRCYRFGDELHATANAPLLKEFLNLLHNKY